MAFMQSRSQFSDSVGGHARADQTEVRMRLYALEILYKDPSSGAVRLLSSAQDLSTYGYFQKGGVKEFMDFTCKILVERTVAGCRASVKEQEYTCHVWVRADSLGGVLISDQEYPNRVGHTLINKALDDFSAKYPSPKWPAAKEGEIVYPELEVVLHKYQNPREADAMSKIQADLDETKIILHNTIEAVLQRGEKLDDLVEKSEGLSMQSKAFYKTARKTNSCCVIL